MSDIAPAPTTVDELRAFVHTMLCAKENLLPAESRLRELVLLCDGRPCGLQFFVQGPRLVQLGAIWAADQNVIYLYDARGERYGKVTLASSIPIEIDAGLLRAS